MEKFPVGKKIRKIAGVAGISILSMLPGDKSQQTTEKKINLPRKEKIEWTRSELDSDGNLREKIAFNWLKEGVEERDKKTLDFVDTSIKEFINELAYRKLNGKPTRLYSSMSDGSIIENIKDLNNELEIYKKNTESYRYENFKKVASLIKEAISYYDIGRKWILDNIQDPEYRKRLALEEKGTTIDEKVDDYINLVKNNRIGEASDQDFVLSKDIKKSYGGIDDGNISSNHIGAFYNTEKNAAYFPMDIDSITAIEYAIHEYAHKVTKADERLSLKAIELFSEAFDSLSVVTNLSGELNKDTIKSVAYFSDPTEMYARKKEFDYDLERLGVKKYGEEFTIMHYLKAIKLQKDGKLSSGSMEFIYSIKPEKILKIMNEIADIGSVQKEDKNLA